MAALMIQGCGSDVGKSVLVAGLCRLFANRGLTVRPFKPQNMSNNAAVTADGGEIGRAQALQAIACRTPPTVDMNPVLLKPQSDIGAQLVVRGQMAGTWKARGYQDRKAALLDVVVDSFRRLEAESDLVIESKENGLVVKGAKAPASEDKREFLHRGIAERAFELRFQLAEYVEVSGASLENGLLHIELKRELPESKKARTIEIKGSAPKALEQVN